MVGLGEAYSLDFSGADRFRKAKKVCEILVSQAQLEGDSGIGHRAFMGFRFDSAADTGPEWRCFGDGLLTIPKLLYRKTTDGYWVTESTVVQSNGSDGSSPTGVDLESAIGRFSAARENAGNQTTWCNSVQAALDCIGSGELEKVVLARSKSTRLPSYISISQILARLMKSNSECTVFAFQRGDNYFIGASPEQLVRVSDGAVESVCLAGSARRGENPEEDERLGETLLGDEKESREHCVVVNEMSEALGALCREVHNDGTPSLLKLNKVQHLATRFRGMVDKDSHILDFVERLHPTAAVAGSPKEVAMKFIRDNEGMDRGWYAGPVGWVDGSGGGEFTIAIRSGLIRDKEAILYAGAGIVAGSDPEEEYRETELKLGSMLGAFEA